MSGPMVSLLVRLNATAGATGLPPSPSTLTEGSFAMKLLIPGEG
jgi:hypothetical protein